LERPVEKKLVTIVLDEPRAVVLGNEPVKVGGRVSGRVTSGGYGPYIGASVAFAYLPIAMAGLETMVEILVFGTWVKGKIVKGPLYDPKGLKVRL
jgi:4-methylaminobutanoate oxidase (formaldehyde-forming)